MTRCVPCVAERVHPAPVHTERRLLMIPVDPLLLATVRVSTFRGDLGLTRASGFLFRRHGRVFLVSCCHVFHDGPDHQPDRVEVELHTHPADLAKSQIVSIPLYRAGVALWRQARDGGGEVDVAVLEMDRECVAASHDWPVFDEHTLPDDHGAVLLGQPVLIAGFPMGFHDELHHLPVVRSGVVASSYGWRFGGRGYFLTDARTHRGLSGAPVVVRRPGTFPWMLMGIHSARLEGQHREPDQDETLSLNSSWYPDVLLVLTHE